MWWGSQLKVKRGDNSSSQFGVNAGLENNADLHHSVLCLSSFVTHSNTAKSRRIVFKSGKQQAKFAGALLKLIGGIHC